MRTSTFSLEHFSRDVDPCENENALFSGQNLQFSYFRCLG